MKNGWHLQESLPVRSSIKCRDSHGAEINASLFAWDFENIGVTTFWRVSQQFKSQTKHELYGEKDAYFTQILSACFHVIISHGGSLI